MKQNDNIGSREIYGLIGFPLGHSFSAKYFADKFSRLGINAEYRNFEISNINMFPDVVASNPDLRGLNVTLPYKQQVMQYLDSVDAKAEAIGAVNAISFERVHEGGVKLVGHNADVVGFVGSLKPLLRPCHTHALVLGTGGASKAVVYGLHSLGIDTQYVSRSKRPDTITYSELTPDVMSEHKLIVNCTPLGMYPKVDACAEIPYDMLTPDHLLFDLVYNPLETLFLKKGREHGATVKNGIEMLHLQAEASWNFWNSI